MKYDWSLCDLPFIGKILVALCHKAEHTLPRAHEEGNDGNTTFPFLLQSR